MGVPRYIPIPSESAHPLTSGKGFGAIPRGVEGGSSATPSMHLASSAPPFPGYLLALAVSIAACTLLAIAILSFVRSPYAEARVRYVAIGSEGRFEELRELYTYSGVRKLLRDLLNALRERANCRYCTPRELYAIYGCDSLKPFVSAYEEAVYGGRDVAIDVASIERGVRSCVDGS